MYINAFAAAELNSEVRENKQENAGRDLEPSSLFLEVAQKNRKSKDTQSDNRSGKSSKKEEPSAMQQVESALRDWKNNKYELSPQIKQKFESAIVRSDKGPSPLLEKLKPEVEKLAQDLAKAMPPENQAKLGILMHGMGEALEESALSDEDKERLKKLLLTRDELEDKKEIDKEIDEIIPGFANSLNEIDTLMKPLLELTGRAEKLTKTMELESKQESMSRYTYARVLDASGDEKAARQQMRAAAARDQSLLEDEHFMSLAEKLGMEAGELKTWDV